MPRGATTVEFYFSTVTGLAMSLEQDPPLVKISKTSPLSKTFRTNIFYVAPLNGCIWIYRQCSESLPRLSCPTCIYGQEGEEGWPVQDLILEVLLASIHWESSNNSIQPNPMFTEDNNMNITI